MTQVTAAANEAGRVPNLPLKHCSVAEHCEALRRIRVLPFWWHLGIHKVFGNYSVPFKGYYGNWWYQVKPGLAWTADCYRRLPRSGARPPLTWCVLGYQHMVADDAESNSCLVINTIEDFQSYSEKRLDAERRKGIRRALKKCVVEVATGFDRETLTGCLAAWNELTERVQWRRPYTFEEFERSFRAKLEIPGADVIIGRDAETGQVAGFVITKILGDTAYVDTIASRTEMRHLRVNEAMEFSFLANAARIPGITRAHGAIKSFQVALEKFKQGLGFVPIAFPTFTRLRGPTEFLLKTIFPAKYRRMMGRFEDSTDVTETDAAPDTKQPTNPSPGRADGETHQGAA
ncbi:MAG: hypothetical protein JNG88_12950 [Phycisphaerales bacterium]|nr:hypothetical protein [Phycisphaerales bacterium]